MAETTPIIRMVLDDTPIEFSGSDVLECSLLLEINPISAVVPVSTASVQVFTTDPRFSIFSDGEFFNALSKHLPVDVVVRWDGYEISWKFYLDSWKMESENILNFELVDLLGVCASVNYPGSFWEEATNLSIVLNDILKETTAIPAIDLNLNNVTVKGWIPPSSVRDALQQVCFAARATVTQVGAYLGFKLASLPIQNTLNPYQDILNAEKTDDQTVTLLPKITDIELISHDYYNLGAEAQTVEEIYSAWLEPGNYIISYPKPYWKVWGTGAGAYPVYIATEDGRVIVTEDSVGIWGDATVRVATESETFMFASNYVSVNVTTAGQITLWGYPWLSADRPHKYHEVSNTPNAISIENAMLVNSANAADVLAKIVEYYALRHQTQVEVFPKTLNIGTPYKIDTLREKQLIGVGERFEIDLTGGFLTKATFRGMEYIPE